MRRAGTRARRGMLGAELAALGAAVVADFVLALRVPGANGGWAAPLTGILVSSGTAIPVLAVLRRRFPRHIGVLGSVVAALSVVTTVVAVAGTVRAQPPIAEVVAAGLLTASAGRRLPPRQAAALAPALGVVMIAAPLLRYDVGAPGTLLAVAAAAYWGACVGVGLILRAADKRQRDALDRVRAQERLQLARELHDLVSHHVSGIVVRVQAARAITEAGADEGNHAAVYREIEEAGGAALDAARSLVGMLRDTEDVPPLSGAVFGDAVRAATGSAARVEIAEELDQLPVPPQLAATVNRVVTEALTNVRRHAPSATEVSVSARTEADDLVLEVRNDGVPATPLSSPGGFGIIGMTERIAMLGGSLTAARERGSSWRVTARLPLGTEDAPFSTLPRGI
ncbi:histidine kinase [Amycolatopsis sp., V23-08]|uniref:histidine kinase n=1 Tax=Amycolatopsis heterodermiae TaxID=3110235 RepID=A0ABU5R7R5_9PSEU|nr:histidine kinase [Amycolatopsis sp., V23-08]MEA5362282.1 histidine kinase [Amycolatopsis sp., V23-08]